MISKLETPPGVKVDLVLAAARDLARGALDGIADPGTVGEYLGVLAVGPRLAVHRFACAAPGYVGWIWEVSLTRVPRSTTATICETNLVPGEGALLSPPWVPYAQRLAPGDLGPGDVLPYNEDDEYLEPGFEATGDEDIDTLAVFELGLGRPRVLSRQGRAAAADRWYAGDAGPASPMAAKAAARCASCGYLLPLAGALRHEFAVCANEWSPVDGKVVALEFGCGAHSETQAPEPEVVPIGEPLLDELRVEPL